MIELKALLGILAVLIALIGYFPYFRDIFLGKTKPHSFSWLIWAVLQGIAFFGQISDQAGAGAWVTGIMGIVCFSVFVIALRKGETEITLLDKVSLCGAGIALLLWFFTGNPLLSILLVTLIDTFGFFPTYRKSYHTPREETLMMYFLCGTSWVISLLALENYSLVTLLYPAAGVFNNFLFVTMVMIRRKQLP